MRDNEPSRRFELALALFCVCGVGVPIVIPDLVPVGAAICLLSAAAAGWLYAADLVRIPLWLLRHRIPATKPPRDIWLGTWLALAVICLGIGAPGYRLFQWEFPPPPAVPALDKPSVVVLWENDQLRIHNYGDSDIYFVGDKLDDLPPIMDAPRTIPKKTGYYYLLSDRFKLWALGHISGNGQKFVSFDIYFTDVVKTRYTAKIGLLIVVNGMDFAVHTQQLGIVNDGW